MKREYLDQLAVWFHAEVEGFKAKGASEDILTEPAFTNLLVETVFQNHIDEILSDPAFVEEIILAHWGTYDSLKSNMCGGAVNETFVYYALA
jgi:hypothetical protein